MKHQKLPSRFYLAEWRCGVDVAVGDFVVAVIVVGGYVVCCLTMNWTGFCFRHHSANFPEPLDYCWRKMEWRGGTLFDVKYDDCLRVYFSRCQRPEPLTVMNSDLVWCFRARAGMYVTWTGLVILTIFLIFH